MRYCLTKYQFTVPWWMFLTTPLPNPNIIVISASQKVISVSSLTQIRYTGIQKFAPEMPADIARVAMTNPTGKRYQYVRSIFLGNPFFIYV